MKKVTIAAMAAMVLVSGASAREDWGDLQSVQMQEKISEINKRYFEKGIQWTTTKNGATEPSLKHLEMACDDDELRQLFKGKNIALPGEAKPTWRGKQLIPYFSMSGCYVERDEIHLFAQNNDNAEKSMIFVKRVKK